MRSIFTNKNEIPTIEHLELALGETYQLWKSFEEFTNELYPNAKAEWNISSEKFGWNYRIKDKKRVIIYLLPRDNFFKIALIFGQKAANQILESDVSETIKTALMEAKVYAEGRGIRIEISDKSNFNDIKKLIKIKILN